MITSFNCHCEGAKGDRGSLRFSSEARKQCFCHLYLKFKSEIASLRPDEIKSQHLLVASDEQRYLYSELLDSVLVDGRVFEVVFESGVTVKIGEAAAVAGKGDPALLR